MASEQQIRSAVQRYLDTVATGVSKDIAALYSAGATVEDPVGSPAHVGRAAIEKFYSALESAQIRTELLTVRVAGDSAAFAFRVTTESDGRTTVIEPIDVMTFDEDAHITSMRAFWSRVDITLG